ncbi:MAG: RNHCP domain-containing protein [Firmicutes bacterium]|nr:RNHCP domain-containing protein [Bacillota bacterium]
MKKFTMRDEVFICENCGKEVDTLKYTARDHCPYCLYSKHVDINPGDRLNSCLGLLKPISIEKFKNTYKIIYKCTKCNELHKNIIANDDNMNLIIELSIQKEN